MRQVKIHAYCEVCEAEVDAEESLITAALDGMRPREMDLCPADRAKFYEPFANLLAEHGRPVGAASNGTGGRLSAWDKKADWSCPFCSKELKVASATSHLRSAHEAKHPKQPKTCPSCKTYQQDDPNSMVAHRARSHGYSVINALIASVRGEADPNPVEPPAPATLPVEAPDGRALCPKCGKDLANRTQIARHLQSDHGLSKIEASQALGPADPDKRADCPICGYVTTLGPGLSRHISQDHPGAEYTDVLARLEEAKA